MERGKLEEKEKEYERLSSLLADPKVLSNRELYRKYAQSHSELHPLVEKYRKYKEVLKELEEVEVILKGEKDEEIVEIAKADQAALRERRRKLEEELEFLSSPEEREDRNTILEIRAGAGGDEASLFAGDLFRMYSRYADRKGWRVEVMSSHPTSIGGFKEIIFGVEGKGAFNELQGESGVHRVQRVPATESGGRIHTSTATVAVLPEAKEVELRIDPKDLRIDTLRSSGPGGQHVNVTDSAVRITHLPTGIVVQCQDERSQHKNKAKAMRVLRSRLFDRLRRKQEEEISQERRRQVGRGERSEKARTYNFPQNRVTDHRIGLTLHRLENIRNGDLDRLIQALRKGIIGES